MQSEQSEYAPGEVLVKFNAGTAPEEIEKLQAQLDLETKTAHLLPDLYLMKINGDTPVKEMIEQLQRVEFVEYAEPNYIRSVN